VAEALEDLSASTPEARSPAALAIGGQAPTSVPSGGGLAVTYRYATGVEGSLEAQQAAQRALLLAEDPRTEVLQVWDFVIATLGGPHQQGRWPEAAVLEGFGALNRTGTAVGVADGSWGVTAGTPLVVGAPDAILTFWAAGLDVPGRGCDPGGRSGGLVVATDKPAEVKGMLRMASPAQGCAMVGGPVSAHGLSLEWLAGFTGRPIDELLELAATVAPGAGGLVFLPYLEGERTPRWRRGLRGEFVGLSSDAGPAELARAVLEGTAYGLRHIATELAVAGLRIDAVTCTGSPSRSRLWCEIKAAVLGAPFEVPDVTELSAYGAALAAGAGAGWWPPPGKGGPGSWPKPTMARIEPRSEPAYDEGFERFLAFGADADRLLDAS
jgi:xylulokinase